MHWDEVSITDLEAGVSPEILERGREYQQTGHIIRGCRVNQIIAGEVAGTGGTYRVQLVLDESKIDGSCTCPYPGFCKHMAALTLAWVEKTIHFIDLDSNLREVLNNPERVSDMFIQLVRKEPLNFLDLVTARAPEEVFLNSRGILNLIRNVFQAPTLTHQQIEAQWERIKRVQELVAMAIKKGQEDASELYQELVKGVAFTFRDNHNELLKKVFEDLLLESDQLLKSWVGTKGMPIADDLFEIYLDGSLWELIDLVRPVLVKYHNKFPDWLHGKLEAVEWQSLEQTELIAIYELLALISENDPGEAQYFETVTEALAKTEEGRLWLIDRIMENNPDQAFILAKEGLRSCEIDHKPAFREKLIEVHLLRSENKQAAALSFIQFQENPNLQEYLRLKTILTEHSRELQNYLGKMDLLIEKQGMETLSLSIAFDRDDWPKLKEKLGQIDPAAVFLKEFSGTINNHCKDIPFEIFQELILRLLTGGRNNWEVVLKLLVSLKKECLKNSWNDQWGELQAILNIKYGEDRKFQRKFGAVLAG